MNKILLIEGCNFTDYPIGGYLSFAKQMISSFGNQLILVGVTDDDTPVGKWVKKNIEGIEFEFFSIRKIRKTNKKPIIPERLKIYLALRKYKNKILKCNVINVFIQTPEVLFSINKKGLNICTRIPGVENPLSISRYSYSKYFAKIFDLFFFNSLKKTNIILATADKNAISDFIKRSNNKLKKEKVFQFPSIIDTDIFKPINKKDCLNTLNLNNHRIIVSTGRLNSLKGWEFMLNAFIEYRKTFENSKFIFLGDGEDRNKIIDFIEKHSLKKDVLITGRLNHRKLAEYLNAADVYVMGSYIEGWSTSLMEAIACGKPAVCTNFSSSKELITSGVNGYVIENRNTKEFSNKMLDCDNLNYQDLLDKALLMNEYSTKKLKNNLIKLWNLK